MAANKESFEKRLNTLIRDFVKVYKKLGAEFLDYKTFVSRENDLYNVIVQKKTDIIERQ